MKRRAGFTLLEVLLSLALVGLLFAGLNTFIFSMGELWGRGGDVRLFDQHVNAVTRFVGQMFQEATLPPSARAGSTPVAIQQITPQSGVADYLITFDLPAGNRLLNWPDRPLPEVQCSLQSRPNDGLYLLWHSRLEARFADDPPREMRLTPLLASLAYDYYDDTLKKWTTQTTLQTDSSGAQELPQRLRLQFLYGKLKRETTIPLPVTLQGLPNFQGALHLAPSQ
jgi:prepilin-type N-terminal cleavage/methylation domain-containing protein